MFSREPINYSRLRRITGSFSWIDHRLLTQGYLEKMTPDEMLLYFFLILVGDKNGISFYNHDRIQGYLKMDVWTYARAREGLMHKALIACEEIRVQVLQLPEIVGKQSPKVPAAVNTASGGVAKSVAEILKEELNKHISQ